LYDERLADYLDSEEPEARWAREAREAGQDWAINRFFWARRPIRKDTIRVCKKCGVEGPHRTLRDPGMVGRGKVTRGAGRCIYSEDKFLPALVKSQCRACERRASAQYRLIVNAT
jgi:hypothetical protein